MKAKPVQIPLTQGKFALVDRGDAKGVSKHKWQPLKRPYDHTFYVRRSVYSSGKRKTVLLHRFILGAKDGQTVDHIDGNGLNNTRKNLRLVTVSQNQHNRRSQNVNNRTGFLGVSKHSDGRKKCYHAKLASQGKIVLCKYFHNKYEAAAMYDHVKQQHAGEHGSYNFDELLSAIQMRNRIYKSGGFFSVVFKKKGDNSIRHMTARTGVVKDLKGGVLRFDPHKKRLVTVYDRAKQDYRMIAIDGILALKINGKHYGKRPV